MKTEFAYFLDCKLKCLFQEFFSAHLHVVVNHFGEKRISSNYTTCAINKILWRNWNDILPKKNIYIVYIMKKLIYTI